MRAVRMTGLAGALVAGGCLVVPGTAAPRASGWVVTRTGSGPAVLSGTMTATARGSGATVTMFALTGRGPRRTHDSAFTTTRVDWGADGWAAVYSSGWSTPSCGGPTCTDPVATGTSVAFSSNGHRIASTVYVAGWDAGTAVTVTSPGWRVRPWSPAMRVVRADEGGGTGVRVLHATTGTFGSVDATGGRYGSFAFGLLPCGMAGEGSGSLSGGGRSRPLVCGGARSWRFGAPAATRWRLSGDVYGVDGVVNVLVVVDYPKQ